MKPLAPFAFGVLAGLVTLQLHAELGNARKLPSPVKQKVIFARDIKPLLDKSCKECHSGEKPKSGYVVDTMESIVKAGDSGDAAVIPGNSAKSPLLHYAADLVEDMEMPPPKKRDKYPALTKEQLSLLRAWIDQGAKY